MKRVVSCIVVIIIILFISSLFFNTENAQTILIQTEYIQTKQVQGIIIEKGDSYYKIMNDNDTIYTIKGKINYNQGDYIKIMYDGQIGYLKDDNEISIKKISKVNNPYDNDIMKYVENLSVEERIGQLIMSKVPSSKKVETIKDYHISGYIYYGEDISNKSIDDVRKEIDNYQSNSNIPLLLAIDEEGGTVSRLSNNKKITSTSFKSPMSLYKAGGFDAIKDDAIRKRNLLVKLGFNVNYAPVIDVVTDEEAYMYNRSFGSDAEKTAEFAKLILSTQTDELTYTFKHFPGYGNNKDTHITKSTDDRTLYDFETNDFIPYKSVINNGAKQIMISHNIVKSIDDVPSSLSLYMHNILRERLGFKGVIITDSLSMSAIEKYQQNPNVRAVLSGNNLIITEKPGKTFNDILESYQSGEISEELLNRLVYRVIELKEDKGLLKIKKR